MQHVQSTGAPCLPVPPGTNGSTREAQICPPPWAALSLQLGALPTVSMVGKVCTWGSLMCLHNMGSTGLLQYKQALSGKRFTRVPLITPQHHSGGQAREAPCPTLLPNRGLQGTELGLLRD